MMINEELVFIMCTVNSAIEICEVLSLVLHDSHLDLIFCLLNIIKNAIMRSGLYVDFSLLLLFFEHVPCFFYVDFVYF